MIKRLKSIVHWTNERLERVYEYDRNMFSWIIGFIVITSISVTIYALGNPTQDELFAHFINIGKYVLLNLIGFSAVTYVLSAFFSFIYLRIPRVALASFMYTVAINVTVLYVEKSGTLFSYTVGFGYSAITAGIIYLAILLFKYKKRVLVSIIVLFLFTGIFFGTKVLNPEETVTPDIDVPGDLVGNPGEKGPFNYEFYTYGSGRDLQRDWFGKNVDEVTPSVDSSHFITSWGKERTNFWGFTEDNLPINGRVWLPEGEGPFPVVLMVHGNHTMEYLSTSGYDYLGEQLASRGFIGISVDEDFINYSNIFGSPNRNYELRAWMMMQHLAHLQTMHLSPESFLYQKVDLDQVGLMGHSRGGQAVAMVADYERFFDDFGDESLLISMENINIRGIVAIAPTDRSIDSERAHLQNVSYLLMHGARDADVNDFGNERQFYRTSFHPEFDGFRASVYIEKANHTQFNTDWGRMDLSLPRGLFLNREQMMKPKEQQQLTKLYMSTFFEAVFNQDKTYEKIFENHFHVKDYLPKTALVTKYNPASYRTIESFQDTYSYEQAEGFDEIEIVTPKHRRGSSRMRDALSLEWTGDASLPINIMSTDFLHVNHLVLTMANANELSGELPIVRGEFLLATGEREVIDITGLMAFPPVIKTDFTHYGLFDKFFRGDRYATDWEPVFQTFHIPVEHMGQIEEIIFHFSAGQGKVMIQEIGIY